MLTRAGPCDSPAVVKRRGMRGSVNCKTALVKPRHATASASPAPFERVQAPLDLLRTCLDVARGEVDHDEPLLAQRVDLHDHIGWVARHWAARTQRTIDRVLQLQLAATDVVGDVDDLD